MNSNNIDQQLRPLERILSCQVILASNIVLQVNFSSCALQHSNEGRFLVILDIALELLDVVSLLLLVESKGMQNAPFSLSSLNDVENCLQLLLSVVENLGGYHDEERNNEGAPECDEDGGDLTTNGVRKDVTITHGCHGDDCQPK